MHTHKDLAQTHNGTLHIITRRLAPVIAKLQMPMTTGSPRSGVFAVSFTGRMMTKWAAATQFPIPPGVMSYPPHM